VGVVLARRKGGNVTDTGPDEERRAIHPRGRRLSDQTALSPDLQAEAAEYAAEIEHLLSASQLAITDGRTSAVAEWLKTMQWEVDALKMLLTSGKSMRQA
jgi:hypothetical protein